MIVDRPPYPAGWYWALLVVASWALAGVLCVAIYGLAVSVCG